MQPYVTSVAVCVGCICVSCIRNVIMSASVKVHSCYPSFQRNSWLYWYLILKSLQKELSSIWSVYKTGNSCTNMYTFSNTDSAIVILEMTQYLNTVIRNGMYCLSFFDSIVCFVSYHGVLSWHNNSLFELFLNCPGVVVIIVSQSLCYWVWKAWISFAAWHGVLWSSVSSTRGNTTAWNGCWWSHVWTQGTGASILPSIFWLHHKLLVFKLNTLHIWHLTLCGTVYFGIF